MNQIKITSKDNALLSGFMSAIEYFCDSDHTDVVDAGRDWIVVQSKDLDTSVYEWELDFHGMNPIE
jgi:hypothetical protein